MSEKKKYYWLKLKKDFFKRHDVRVIEGMDNGKDYVLFYLKLLVESIDHDGNLRFNDMIPYDDKMLSSVTNTNIDIVRSAIQIFKALGLIEILDDKTIYMKQIESFIGAETNWAKQKRLQRIEKADNVHQLSTSSPPQVHQEYRDKSIEYRDKSIEIRDKNIEKKKSIRNKRLFVEDSIEFQLSKKLLDYILINNPNYKMPNLQNWAQHIDYMIRLDKRTPEQINDIIVFSQEDSFWKSNVLSTEKLRQKFDQLWIKKKNGKPKSTFEILQAEYEKEVENEQNRNHQITGSH